MKRIFTPPKPHVCPLPDMQATDIPDTVIQCECGRYYRLYDQFGYARRWALCSEETLAQLRRKYER